MSDLRAMLQDRRGGSYLNTEDILAALAAADEPLTATVECNDCGGDPHRFSDLRIPVCPACDGTGTVRIVAMNEDVLRARLRDVEVYPWPERVVDAIVRALFGGDQ